MHHWSTSHKRRSQQLYQWQTSKSWPMSTFLKLPLSWNQSQSLHSPWRSKICSKESNLGKSIWIWKSWVQNWWTISGVSIEFEAINMSESKSKSHQFFEHCVEMKQRTSSLLFQPCYQARGPILGQILPFLHPFLSVWLDHSWVILQCHR